MIIPQAMNIKNITVKKETNWLDFCIHYVALGLDSCLICTYKLDPQRIYCTVLFSWITGPRLGLK